MGSKLTHPRLQTLKLLRIFVLELRGVGLADLNLCFCETVRVHLSSKRKSRSHTYTARLLLKRVVVARVCILPLVLHLGPGSPHFHTFRIISILRLKSEPSGYSDAGRWPLVSNGNAIL